MAEQLDSSEMVTIEEMVLAQMFEQEALINVLERKGFLTKVELLEEVQRLREKATRAH